MHMNRFETACRSISAKWFSTLAIGLAIGFATQAIAQAPAAAGGVALPPSPEELSKLVGRIALYPDDLVAIILPASTNPLQLVQADRFLDKRKADPKLPIDDKWDDAVKSLLNYPDVVKMMSNDLEWTTALGEAVVADQGAVIDAVQAFRRQAQAVGNLKSDDKQVVKVEKEIVYIEPADPQVIYVPQYNPTTVVVAGAPVYGYYPTPYPSYYYPYAPGAALAAGVIWGAAIGAAWSGNRYGCCGDANINVNRNTNINTGNRGGRASQLPAGGGSAWKSNKQPGQVGRSVGNTASSPRVGDRGAGGGGFGSAGGGAGRASAQPAGGGMGGGAGRGGASGNSAFGGYGSGRQTQMDSSRGASSRNSMSGGGASRGASRSSSGGGARGGGGGGGRGGGGGGGRGGGRR
jgi:hypothetical protein